MIAALASAAWAATCCGSGPPVDPGSLGSDEALGVSVGLAAGAMPLRWSSGGQLHAQGEGELGLALGARIRATRWLQSGLVLPAAVRMGELGVSAGLTEAQLLVRAETRSVVTGRPRPALVLGGSAPLQTPQDSAPWWKVLVAPTVELSGERTQASLSSSLSLPLWTAQEALVRPGATWELAASAGPRTSELALSFGLGLRGTTPGLLRGEPAGVGSLSPLLRAASQITLSERARLLAHAQLAPPVPYLGRNADADVTLGTSLLKTW